MTDEEFQGEDGVQEPAAQGDGGRPVEVLQAASLLKAGRAHPDLDAPILPSADRISEDDLQEGRVVQVVPAGQGDALGQGVQHGAELQALEQRDQFGIAGYGRPLSVDWVD